MNTKRYDDLKARVARAEQAEASAAAMREALDLAWGLIANANGGDWTRATPEWRAAAERWRDEHYSKRDTAAGSQMLERVRNRDAAQRALAVCVMQRDEAREALRGYRDEHDAAMPEKTGDPADNCSCCFCDLCERAKDILEVKP